MSKPLTYKHTLRSCYLGYIVQAIIANLAPLFFVTFQTAFAISFEQIGRLILLTFGTQLVVDLLSVKFVDKIGYRASLILAHGCSVAGLVLLGILPRMLPDPYTGLVVSVTIYAVGGGLIEVLISPIVDSLPSEAKASSMSLLHAFYSWGQVLVILITTVCVGLTGDGVWWVYPLVWAAVPLLNLFQVIRVPLMPPPPDEDKVPLRRLFSSRAFLVGLLMMMCAGAAELSMSQWSSLFAEKGLGVPKLMGDLLGPCLFGLLMGVGRTVYGIWGSRFDLKKAMLGSAALCIVCYAVTVFVPSPLPALLGCAFCGLSVSLMWPGTISLSAARFPGAGTAMFGMLALAGDLGCSLGPWLTGVVSDTVQRIPSLADAMQGSGLAPDQWGLRAGLAVAVVFPLLLLIGVSSLRKTPKKTGAVTAPEEAGEQRI